MMLLRADEHDLAFCNSIARCLNCMSFVLLLGGFGQIERQLWETRKHKVQLLIQKEYSQSGLRAFCYDYRSGIHRVVNVVGIVS